MHALRMATAMLSGALVACNAAAPPQAAAPPSRAAAPAHAAAHAPAPILTAAAPASPPTASAVPVDDAPAAPAPPIDCPEGEVAIPATGDAGFIMGRGKSDGDTPHKVILTHAFCIDADEVSAGDFEKCVDAGACRAPGTEDEWASYKRHPDQPIDLVDWEKARQYCGWRGERLPTEAEWEWAASGPERTRFPWGDTPAPSCDYVDYTPGGAPKWKAGGDVGCNGGGPSPVGAHPLGDKVWPWGHIHDLAGNVFEWVEDSFAPYTAETATDPLVRQETAIQAIRGGAWNRPGPAMETAFRASAWYLYQVPGLGFRCVRGARHPTLPPRQKKWG